MWNGKEAVEAYTAADSGAYRLTLMDMQMPVMNGMEAAQAIRSSGRPDAKRIPDGRRLPQRLRQSDAERDERLSFETHRDGAALSISRRLFVIPAAMT